MRPLDAQVRSGVYILCRQLDHGLLWGCRSSMPACLCTHLQRVAGEGEAAAVKLLHGLKQLRGGIAQDVRLVQHHHIRGGAQQRRRLRTSHHIHRSTNSGSDFPCTMCGYQHPYGCNIASSSFDIETTAAQQV